MWVSFTSRVCVCDVKYDNQWNAFLDTPRHLYFLHTMTWLLNMFGIFFILAAHEHYSELSFTIIYQ